jgi:hypothetical protein
MKHALVGEANLKRRLRISNLSLVEAPMGGGDDLSFMSYSYDGIHMGREKKAIFVLDRQEGKSSPH